MSEIWNLSTLCRCCHADGYFKSLNLPYPGQNDVEVYENMLRDTLGVTISTPPVEASYTICDQCILKLQQATEFKKQVLMCEQKFQVYCDNEQFVTQDVVKLEEPDNDSDGDMDNDNAPEIDDKPEVSVKEEFYIEVDTEHPIKKEEQPKCENLNEVTEETSTERKIENKSNIKTPRVRKKQQNTAKTKRENINLSLITEVKTDVGINFSCKECCGNYPTLELIKKHILKSHLTLIKCEYCPKQLLNTLTYKRHLKLHTGKEFKCAFCPKAYSTKYSLSEHQNSHTKERMFQCDLCQKMLKSRSSMIKHLSFHAGTARKKLCDLCGWSFNDATNLRKHIQSVHEKLRPHNCSKCNKSFTNQRHLKEHIKRHCGLLKMYKCDVCGHRMSCPKTMRIHRLKHDNKFMCRFCSVIFDDVNIKNEHVREMHREALHCPICGKLFSAKYSLQRHINDHNGIKRFHCQNCDLSFSQKSMLTRHISRKHNPEIIPDIEKTKCDICKRSFKNMRAHMDKHENRNFACEICGKTYPNNSTLNRHKNCKHFGRSFECDICSKKYMQKAKLNTHKLRVHHVKIENVSPGIS